MKAEDIRAKSVDELKKLLLDTRKNQFNLRFQQANGSLNDTTQVRKTRRLIARVKTILAQKAVSSDASKGKKQSKAKKAA